MNKPNKKLLEFYKENPYTWNILYKINNINYLLIESYLSSIIEFHIDDSFVAYLDIDGIHQLYKNEMYIFNLYLLLRMFIIYEAKDK